MPSRVRIVASHPVYGKFLGTGAFRTIEERCKVDNYHIPVMFASWPRWKRVMWLAKGEGKWKIKVFREPRGTKLRKSLYGKEILAIGLKFPPKIRKKDKNRIKGDERVYRWNAKPPQLQVRAVQAAHAIDDIDRIIARRGPGQAIPIPGPNGEVVFQIPPMPNDWVQQQYIDQQVNQRFDNIAIAAQGFIPPDEGHVDPRPPRNVWEEDGYIPEEPGGIFDEDR